MYSERGGPVHEADIIVSTCVYQFIEHNYTEEQRYDQQLSSVYKK